MKRASQILLLVGEIVEIVGAILLLALGIGFLVFALPNMTQVLIDGLQNGTIHTTFTGTVEDQARAIQALFSAISVFMFVLAALNAVGAIITIFARRLNTTGILIATIAFAILSGSEVAAVGAIFGLITIIKEESKQTSAQ